MNLKSPVFVQVSLCKPGGFDICRKIEYTDKNIAMKGALRLPATKKRAVKGPSSAKRRRKPRRRKTRVKGSAGGYVILGLLLLMGLAAAAPRLGSVFHREVQNIQEINSSVIHTTSLSQCPYENENFTDNPDGTISYEDETYTSLAGIDVSSHQSAIDWTAVAADGISFAIVRLGWRGYSQGELCKDELCLENLQAARDNGLLVGAYFYSQAVNPEEAQEEAELALEALDGFALDLPIYFDWELATNAGSRSAAMDHSTLTECAKAFCSTIEAAGYEAGIYFYRSLGEDTYDMSTLSNYDFWLSQPASRPSFDLRFSIWQYTYEGQVDGISGNVDLDIMFVPKESEESEN